MSIRILLIALVMAFITSESTVFAGVYQWIDANGSEHFSDSQPSDNGNSNKSENLNFKKRNEPTSSSALQKNDNSKSEIIIFQNKTSKIAENNKINPDTEREIKSTWRAFRDAISRGNAQEAVNHLASSARAEQLETFKELGNKLPLLAREMNDITEIKRVYDDRSAVAIMYRNEMVAGKMTNVEFSIDLIKENGRWKIISY